MRRQAYAAISLTLFLILPASPSQTLAQTKPEAPLTGASWQQCLIHYAQTLAIDPDLFHAIVQTESAGHPWALGWTDQTGRRHSYQISSQHLGWLARHHQIQSRDLLEPCVNLYASSLILQTSIQKHGRTWRAVAGYNGSTAYIPAVWKHFCQRAADAGCSSGRSTPPLPSAPLPPPYDRDTVEMQRNTGGTPISWKISPVSRQRSFQRPHLEETATHTFDLLNVRALLVVTLALLCGGIGLLLILALGGRLVLLAVYIVREGLYMLRRQRAAHHRLTG